jgi:hypothetical protein
MQLEYVLIIAIAVLITFKVIDIILDRQLKKLNNELYDATYWKGYVEGIDKVLKRIGSCGECKYRNNDIRCPMTCRQQNGTADYTKDGGFCDRFEREETK